MEKYFSRFLEKHNLISRGAQISSDKLSELRNDGYLVEDFLDYLNETRGWLFHGSHVGFSDSIRPSDRDGLKIFVTQYGSIALLKATLSNENADLGYPGTISRKQNFPVIITGLNERTIKERGFVYIVNRDDTFEKGRYDIELVKHCQGRNEVLPYLSRLEVLLTDFEIRHKIKELKKCNSPPR